MIDKLMENLPAIVTVIVAIGVVKGYMKKLSDLRKNVEELEAAIVEAMKDEKLTEDELKRIIKEARDIPGAINKCIEPIRKLWGKILRRQK